MMSIKPEQAVTSFAKYFSLFLGCFIAVVPLLVVVLASFKTGDEFVTSGLFEAPQSWANFENYEIAFTRGRMLQGFWNTTIIMVASLTGTILFGTMAAYVLNRFEFRFKRLIIGLFLLATLVPGVTTQVATFQVVNFLCC